MKNRKPQTIIVVGAGMIGLSAALGFVRAGFSVVVVDQGDCEIGSLSSEPTARVSSLHLRTKQFFESLGVWCEIARTAISPLRHMVVWDELGGGEIEFNAAMADDAELGYIVENRHVRHVLLTQLKKESGVSFCAGVCPTGLRVNDEGITVELDDGNTVAGDLLCGADGKNSWVREQMETNLHQRAYHHDAIVAVLSTQEAHRYTAFQNFMPTGPLGVLPLSDAHQVSIVWSATRDFADSMMAMSDIDFNVAVMNAMQMRLGDMKLVSERVRIPLVMRHAENYISSRIALMGDAAHTIHPLAGQGANLGFMDAAKLIEVVKKASDAGKAAGAFLVLRQYERARKGENTAMIKAMRGFKELFSSVSPLVVQSRSMGFAFANRLTPLKRAIINLLK